MSDSSKPPNNTEEKVRKFIKKHDIKPILEKDLSKYCSSIIYCEKVEVIPLSGWEDQCSQNQK